MVDVIDTHGLFNEPTVEKLIPLQHEQVMPAPNSANL